MAGVAMHTVSSVAVIRRLGADRARWRVKVEMWPAAGGFAGRFVFESDDVVAPAPREGPAVLAAASREDLVRDAHQVSERDLLALFRSLV